jgi:tRNA 2-thiouridine synthesizing protein A
LILANADETLDCSGLDCPLPLVNTKKAIDRLQVGQVLRMISTDPLSPIDIAEWTDRTGHELVGSEKSGGQFIFLIRKTKGNHAGDNSIG